MFIHWGVRWGATKEEYEKQMTGDSYLDGGPSARIVMTRAISINAAPDIVWKWIAQIGRGAGWYSYDFLDNGRKKSVRHIVSWIPEPQLGDASAIGYLRCFEPGTELVWWLSGEKIPGSVLRMVVNFSLFSENGTTRLVMRVSGDASGKIGRLFNSIFQVIDTIMARRQLLGIKERAEKYGTRMEEAENPENGMPDQYQLYEVIYADGKMAGVSGKEKADIWRKSFEKEWAEKI